MGATVGNSAVITFPGSGTVSHVSLWDQLSGGTFLGKAAMDAPQQLPVSFAVNTLTVAVPDSVAFSDASDVDALSGRIETTNIRYLQVHSGDPGTDGTGSPISGVARQEITWGTVVAA